jgi:hypothetical protein
MSRSHVSVLFVAAFTLSPLAARAQVEPGTRVRVTAPGFAKRPVVGVLSGFDEGDIRIQTPPCSPRARAQGLCRESRELIIPRDSVTRLQVSHGRSGRSHRASLGAVTGLALGAIVGVAAGEDCSSLPPGGGGLPDFSATLRRNLCISRTEAGVLLGLSGAVLGALVGAAIAPAERWGEVGLGGADVGVAPLLKRDGLGLALSFSF